jgi:hypothetical protein
MPMLLLGRELFETEGARELLSKMQEQLSYFSSAATFLRGYPMEERVLKAAFAAATSPITAKPKASGSLKRVWASTAIARLAIVPPVDPARWQPAQVSDAS